jgi:hypothetical protein
VNDLSVVTPDGERYLAAASGRRVARPFHYRWLIPRLCGISLTNWRAMRLVSLAALCGAAYLHGGFGWRGLFVAAFPIGCAGVWRIHRDHPVLVDLPAMAVCLWAAVCVQHGCWIPAVLLAIVAGTIKETSPVFAALWAWNPILLVGLVAPAVRHLQHAGPDVLDDENRWILDHPFRASRKYHQGYPLRIWVLPWGVGIAGLAVLSWPLAVTVAFAYAQCLIATDTVRLYQWAWPTVAIATAAAVPPAWWLPAIVLHFTNPFATRGG